MKNIRKEINEKHRVFEFEFDFEVIHTQGRVFYHANTA